MTPAQPKHVAIIMDGNGRWAEARCRTRTHGHLRGARVAKNIISAAVNTNIQYLTLFAFSNENWFRPDAEVHFLMRLLARQIAREQATLMKNNVRFRVIGDLKRLPQNVQAVVNSTILMTENNTGLTLVFALSYGGRQEVVKAAQLIAEKIHSRALSPDQIDERLFSNHLESSFMPDPDLIIRTSGEQRLSNFFLWQAAYSEIYTIDKFWPDFTAADFSEALSVFSSRRRRFGRVLSEENTMISAPTHELNPT